MNGLKINDVALFIGKLPGRKQNCFYFSEGSKLLPIAYIKDKYMPEVERLWNKMLEKVRE